MAERKPKKPRKRTVKKGPKGGRKHTPGKDHDRKSHRKKADRFRRKAQRRRDERSAEAERQWEVWDRLTEDQKRLREDLRPTLPRPNDDDAN